MKAVVWPGNIEDAKKGIDKGSSGLSVTHSPD